MLYRHIMAVYCENEQNIEFNVNPGIKHTNHKALNG
jgi:hypothetical protein